MNECGQLAVENVNGGGSLVSGGGTVGGPGYRIESRPAGPGSSILRISIG